MGADHPPAEGLAVVEPKVCTQVHHGKVKVVSACVINMSHGSSVGFKPGSQYGET